jgi:hypothetical protein
MNGKSATIFLSGDKLCGKTIKIEADEEYFVKIRRINKRINFLNFYKNVKYEYSGLNPSFLSLTKIAVSRFTQLVNQNGLGKTMRHLFPYKVKFRISNLGISNLIGINITGDERQVWTSRLAVNSGIAPYALNHSQEYDFARFQGEFAAFIWDVITPITGFSDSRNFENLLPGPLSGGAEVKVKQNLPLGKLTYHDLRNADILHAKTVISDGEVIPTDMHNFTDGSWPTDSIFSRNQISFVFNKSRYLEKFKGSYVFLGSSTSWFHFLVEIFPRYLMLDPKLLQSCAPVVETKTPSQILEVLALISNETPIILYPGQRASFEVLYSCTESRYPLGLDLLNRKNDILLVRDFFRDRFQLSTKAAHRNIFIKRNKNLFRYSGQIEFLSEICEEMGFEIIDSGILSMQEQVNLFASAKLIIGETGSSLTNLLFCNSEATVIEMNLHNFMPGFFRDFCRVININHIVVDKIYEAENTCEVSIAGLRQNFEDFVQEYL